MSLQRSFDKSNTSRDCYVYNLKIILRILYNFIFISRKITNVIKNFLFLKNYLGIRSHHSMDGYYLVSLITNY